jgi:leucyl aminopeptidase (aminopeptidase T)
MIKLMFVWLVLTGQVKYQQTMDGVKQYALFFEDGKVVDYATKAEICEYIETGTFEYDEDLGR